MKRFFEQIQNEHIISITSVKRPDEIRYATVLGGLPFYQSTGKNSGQKGTWFPFRGFLETQFKHGHKTFPKGYVIKPNTSPVDINDIFPDELITYLRNNLSLKSVFSRMGNFVSMCFSMLIGGGFWDQKEGIMLKTFLMSKYKNQIDDLYQKNEPVIEKIKLFNSDNNDTKTFSIDEPDKINLWLKEHGSLGKKSTPWSVDINFRYSDFKIKENNPRIAANDKEFLEKLGTEEGKVRKIS